MLHKTGIDTYG